MEQDEIDGIEIEYVTEPTVVQDPEFEGYAKVFKHFETGGKKVYAYEVVVEKFKADPYTSAFSIMNTTLKGTSMPKK